MKNIFIKRFLFIILCIYASTFLMFSFFNSKVDAATISGYKPITNSAVYTMPHYTYTFSSNGSIYFNGEQIISYNQIYIDYKDSIHSINNLFKVKFYNSSDSYTYFQFYFYDGTFIYYNSSTSFTYNNSNTTLDKFVISTTSFPSYISDLFIPYSYSNSLDNPTNVVFNSYTGILSWNSVANATRYVVDDGHGNVLWQGNSTSVKLDDSQSFTNGTYYLYAADGSDYKASSGVSFLANYVGQAKLETPDNISIDSTTKTITWDCVSNASSYTIQFYMGQSQWGTLDTVNTNSYTYSDIYATYRYRLKIIANSSSEQYISSDPSSIFSLSPTAVATSPIITINNSIISWNSVDNNATYSIYYSSTSNGTFSKIYDTQSLNYSCSYTGYYYVTAKTNYLNESLASSIVSYSSPLALPTPQITYKYISGTGFNVTAYFDINTTSLLVYKNGSLINTITTNSTTSTSFYITDDGTYYLVAHSDNNIYSNSSQSNSITINNSDYTEINSNNIWDTSIESLKQMSGYINVFLTIIGGTLFSFLPPQINGFMISALLTMVAIAVIKVLI